METLIAYAGKALAAVSAPLNAVKDGYLAAVGWIEAHPHRTLLLGGGYVVVSLINWLVF